MGESLEDFLSPSEEQQVIDAIRKAELHSSGEIRVHLERFCQGDPMKRAREVFSILDMHNTRLQNAILIYVAVNDHRFAVCGDIGIHSKVGPDFWSETKAVLTNSFKAAKYAEGLSNAVKKLGQELEKHFPRLSEDANELPDSISTS